MRISKASAELATAPLFDCIIENKILEAAQEEAHQTVLDFIKS
jgi:guanylate kinase